MTDLRENVAEWMLAPLLVMLGWALKTLRARDMSRITRLRKWKHKHIIPWQQWDVHMIELLCERTGVEFVEPPKILDDTVEDEDAP